MMASVPFSAAPGPPETGASTKAPPRAAIAAATRCVTAISVVEKSTTVLPSRSPIEVRPCAPMTTSSTAWLVVTQMQAMSASAAASAGEPDLFDAPGPRGLALARIDVVADDAVAGRREALGEARAHEAEPDEADGSWHLPSPSEPVDPDRVVVEQLACAPRADGRRPLARSR